MKKKSVDQTTKIYQQIYTISIIMTAIFIAIFVIDLRPDLHYHFGQALVGNLLRLTTEAFIYSAIGASTFGLTYCFVKLYWKRTRENIWVDGFWLSIHDKPEPRIGTVTIKQNFHQINVTDALNISPDENKDRLTKWYYPVARVYIDDAGSLKYIGYYKSERIDEGFLIKKRGIHSLSKYSTGSENVTAMYGSFADIVEISPNGEVEASSDSTGVLYLFKATDDCEMYLKNNKKKGNIDKDKLRGLHEHESFKGTPYARKLKDLLEKRLKQEQGGEQLEKQSEEQLKEQLEKLLKQEFDRQEMKSREKELKRKLNRRKLEKWYKLPLKGKYKKPLK